MATRSRFQASLAGFQASLAGFQASLAGFQASLVRIWAPLRVCGLLIVAASCGASHGQVGGGAGATSGGGNGNAGGAGSGFIIPDGGLIGTDALGLGEGQTCNPKVIGLIRDFTPATNPDFEKYQGNGPSLGIVLPDLGTDKKPVYSQTGKFTDPQNGDQVTGPDSFNQWYRNVDGVNMPFEYEFMFTAGANGVQTFDAPEFFPIDNRGFGNSKPPLYDQDYGHNFSFTTELHLTFAYKGGEKFTFTGDDDVWVFINNKLAVDLGGLHPQVSGSVDLDQDAAKLGITKGQTYPMDLFHAERHTTESHFRVDTSLQFNNCNKIIIP